MIGLDTNVLVRFLVQDNTEQCLLVDRLLQSFSAEQPGFIPLAVVVELVWVMQGSYGETKEGVIALLENFLQTKELVVENAQVVAEAVRIYGSSIADFTDCLIERSANQARCTQTLTLDAKAAKTAGMRRLEK